MGELISTHTKKHTLILTLNRPKVMNALNQDLLKELADKIEKADENSAIRGIIITGAGDKAFAAGADIGELAGLGVDEGSNASQLGQSVFEKIEYASKPVVAAVNGFALGGGCELAMACHMRIASENAKFGQPEVKLGLIAGYGGTQRLVRHIGQAKATELLLTGAMIDAQEALAFRLVNYVTTQVELIDLSMQLLSKIYQQSPLAISHTLDAIRATFTNPEGFARESKLFGEAIASDDGKEGTAAFIEKRKPQFTGK